MIKRRWTNDDEERLIKLLQMKVKQSEIAKALARTPAAIQNKINELKEQSVTPIKSDVRRTVIISEMGKPISVLTPEKVVVIKKEKLKKVTKSTETYEKELAEKFIETAEMSSTYLTFNLFGEKQKIEKRKMFDFVRALTNMSNILNKEIEIKFK